jgi:hypothetical protein
MKLNKLSCFSIAFILLLTSCKKDNYEAPSSSLNGRVVYQGQTIGVRTPINGGGGAQLELWQPGFALFQKIPVYVNQDGTFSASLFDGNYKLVMLKGSGPWVDNTDTINVQVSGATTIDFPVQPYFTIKNETIQKAGNAITANCKVDQVVATRAIERVTLYVGTTQFVDQNVNSGTQNLTGAALSNLSQPLSFNYTIPSSLAGRSFVYARIGVKATGISEMVYTQVQKINL